jgi:hypothetical protein
MSQKVDKKANGDERLHSKWVKYKTCVEEEVEIVVELG